MFHLYLVILNSISVSDLFHGVQFVASFLLHLTSDKRPFLFDLTSDKRSLLFDLIYNKNLSSLI